MTASTRVGRAVQQRVLQRRARGPGRAPEPASRSGPVGSSHTAPLARSDTATGSSGTVACPRRNRRRASAVIGSMPSTGPVCGAIRRVASHWSPQPDPELPEVRIVRPAFPQPARGEHRRPGRRVRVQLLERRPLLGGEPPDPAPERRPGSAGSPGGPRRSRRPGWRHRVRRHRSTPCPGSRSRTSRRTATTSGCAARGRRRTRSSRAASPPAAAGPARPVGTARSGSGGGSTSSSPPGSRGRDPRSAGPPRPCTSDAISGLRTGTPSGPARVRSNGHGGRPRAVMLRARMLGTRTVVAGPFRRSCPQAAGAESPCPSPRPTRPTAESPCSPRGAG